MKLKDLPAKDLADRLRAEGILLRTGPFTLRLGTSLPELAESIQMLYADHQLEIEGGIVDFEVRVEPMSRFRRSANSKARFIIDGLRMFEPFERRIALPMLEWAVNWCTFTRPHQFFMLHSAVVERNGHAIILPGPPGAGKSTLCAAMMFRGWRLLSDELAVMRPGTIDLIPIPRPIGLKEESIGVIRRFEPGAVLGPSSPGTRKGTVAHVKPPADSVRRAEEKAIPRWIIFPSYQAGEPATLTPASKAQTLLWLADDAFNFSILGTIAFETLADLIDRCDCYELRYGNLDEAIELLNDMKVKITCETGVPVAGAQI